MMLQAYQNLQNFSKQKSCSDQTPDSNDRIAKSKTNLITYIFGLITKIKSELSRLKIYNFQIEIYRTVTSKWV